MAARACLLPSSARRAASSSLRAWARLSSSSARANRSAAGSRTGRRPEGEQGREERRGRRERLRHFHHHHRHRRTGGAAAGLLHQRGRACPTGEGDHQHRGAERWGGVGLGLDQGLLQQEAIADRTGSAAVASPIRSEGLDPPAELLGGTADGAISAPGPRAESKFQHGLGFG